MIIDENKITNESICCMSKEQAQAQAQEIAARSYWCDPDYTIEQDEDRFFLRIRYIWSNE